MTRPKPKRGRPILNVQANRAIEFIEQNRELLIGLSDRVWEYAELALHEAKSAQCLAEALSDFGFDVQMGVAGMPTAFVATWGKARPVIGLLGEYDALAGVSQAASARRHEVIPGGPGHGCGHNLLGVGSLAAAVALKKELEERQLDATIKFFGCPAEENFSGKAFMARDGLFETCDACLTWHPGSHNAVRANSSLAVTAMNIRFAGRTAHAAADPYNGRSALDAVQIMNMGVEFLREHVPPSARVHYVITNGGLQPNVVPASASVWYMIRSPERHEVDALYQRVIECAEGAAQMTATTFDVEMVEAIANILRNPTLEKLLQQCLEAVGPPRFSAEHVAFAREIRQSFPDSRKDETDPRPTAQQVLHQEVLAGRLTQEQPRGSTDVGDVSWCSPTSQFSTACTAIGTPGHSWQYTAQAGMGIGHEGMLCAAKVLAEAALQLITTPAVLEAARDEFSHLTGGKRYESSMPPGMKPAFHLFEKPSSR